MEHKAFRLAEFKAVDEKAGIFEAIVAVFDNVDRDGDKIVKGAFTDSLADWAAKGRPIPVIFSHKWDNLDAHIGEVLEAKEVDEGLYVKGQLEMDEPYAQRVWKKMARGTLAEFSFAYDVVEHKWEKDVRLLSKLDILEVGPTLVGMNPETQLLGVKYSLQAVQDLAGGIREIKDVDLLEISATSLALAQLGLKEGRRNSAKDGERIQRIHDLTVELGAKCAEPDNSDADGEGGTDGKGHKPTPSGPGASTYAAQIAVELLALDE